MAETAFEIPLISSPQTMSVQLSGTTYNLEIRWNQISQYWVLDIYDQNDNLIVGGLSLVTGGDLLASYRYLGFVGSLMVQTDTDTLAAPTFTNLGSTSHLYYLPDAA